MSKKDQIEKLWELDLIDEETYLRYKKLLSKLKDELAEKIKEVKDLLVL